MAALHLVDVSEEVINAIDEIQIGRSTKDATELGGTLFKSKM